MIHQLFHIPVNQKFILACSGGVDSMAIADFYHRGGKNFSLAYFHHGTPQADEMQECVVKWAQENKRQLHLGFLGSKEKPKDQSPEEFWRNERYAWLRSLDHDIIITAHHLDDVVEGWIFSSLHGDPKVMNSQKITGIIWASPRIGDPRKTACYIYRPFLTTTKQELIDWATRHNVSWVEDKSNADISTPRNRIRHVILPELLKINPGLAKVIKKKITAQELYNAHL